MAAQLGLGAALVSLFTACSGTVLDSWAVAEAGDTADLLQRVRADLHPGQLAFVEATGAKIVGLTAGYGAGKTVALCAKALHLAAANPGFLGCVMEPTGPLIRDIWQRDFEEFLERYDVPYSFRASPLPEYTIHLPEGDTTILCRSFENWPRIIGLNLSWVLADEIDTVAPSIADRAFPKILGRLRAGNLRQFGSASTPEGFRWMWNTFASEAAQGRDDRLLIRMRTVDNPHLPPDFVETLRENYDPQLLRAYLDGDFVNLTTGQVYDRFSRDLHVWPDMPEPDPEVDTLLLIGCDFNVGNCNAVLAFRRGRELHVWDEVAGAHDTDAMGAEIVRRYPEQRLAGYPDASGANRSTNSSRSDIAILQSYGISNNAPSANPPIRDRVASVQALLCNGKGEVRLRIHPRCRKLIESLELQSYSERGEPDKSAGHDHLCDALGYLVHRTFEVGRATAGKAVGGIRLYGRQGRAT
jgi:hypothetical protein